METGTDVCLISDGIKLAMLKGKLGADYCQKNVPCASYVQLSPWCLEMWSKMVYFHVRYCISQVTRLSNCRNLTRAWVTVIFSGTIY